MVRMSRYGQHAGRGVLYRALNLQNERFYKEKRATKAAAMESATNGVLDAIRAALVEPDLPYELKTRTVPRTKRKMCSYRWRTFDNVRKQLVARAQRDEQYYFLLEYFAGLLLVCALDRVHETHTTPENELNYGHASTLFKVSEIILKTLNVLDAKATTNTIRERLRQFRKIAEWTQHISVFNATNVNMSNSDKLRKMAHHHVEYVKMTKGFVKRRILDRLTRRRGVNLINTRALHLSTTDQYVHTLLKMLHETETS